MTVKRAAKVVAIIFAITSLFLASSCSFGKKPAAPSSEQTPTPTQPSPSSNRSQIEEVTVIPQVDASRHVTAKRGKDNEVIVDIDGQPKYWVCAEGYTSVTIQPGGRKRLGSSNTIISVEQFTNDDEAGKQNGVRITSNKKGNTSRSESSDSIATAIIVTSNLGKVQYGEVVRFSPLFELQVVLYNSDFFPNEEFATTDFKLMTLCRAPVPKKPTTTPEPSPLPTKKNK